MAIPTSLLLPERDYFSRKEALALGETDQSLRAALRSGILVRLRHGAYTTASKLEGLDDEELHLLVARAAFSQQRGEVALAGPTATLFHGFDVFSHDLSDVHLARLDRGSARRETGVVHHQVSRSVALGVRAVNGVLVVSPEDAVWQTMLLSSLEGGVVTADSALHRRRELVEPLAQVMARSRTHPRSRTARLALRLARHEAESVGESLTRMACYRHGIPAPELQQKVWDASGVLLGRTDFWWEAFALVGEFDGRVKYERLIRDDETASDAVVREKTREDNMRSTQRGMARFIWPEVQPGRTERRMAKLAHELEQSRRLYVRVAG